MTREAVLDVSLVAGADALGELSDIVLVRQCQSGHREAFSELVRRHQNLVFNVAFRYMRNKTAAEDMAQEAFLKAFRLLKGFRGDCSFATWMYRVTSTTCLSELSKKKRRNEVALEARNTELLVAKTPKPEDLDMKERIRRCVTRLPSHYATAITLYYLKEVSYDEIAQALEIPQGTLKTWMFRARRQLRKIVEKELFSNE
ncbi:MAG: RNA polymerase sigma factor [Candidatus Hydrogenedens sp.]|nr:RNA polymerase sigma factor [Candidatus Hydrogenedens sp.]